MEELRRLNTIWLERTNPLRGLSISRATSMFDAARVWGSPRLQYAYNEIEATDPVLMTCVERRQSALSGLGYRFIASSSEDKVLADEQRDALDKFVSGIENFSEALEHMDLAFFRGFAHAQPIWEGDAVRRVNLLDSWNFLRNDAGEWLWNPACHETTGGLEPIGPDARLVSLFRRRAIDYPALMIYIRHALGDRDWGRFIERYAIPPVHFEMAPGAEEKDKPLYQEAGDAAHNGQNTIRPNGSHIDFAAEARGADPFTPFIEHQDKYIVLLATGGTLTSLAQADTGSLAGGAQMDVWREIVARDGLKIAEALNRSLFRRYLELKFPGRPVAARFELSNETKPTANEIADLAVKLKGAGYVVEQSELEEAVGLSLEKDEVVPGAGYTVPGAPFMNKAPSTKRQAPSTDILAAFAKDMNPAGKAVAELLNNPSKETAEKLLAGLDDLMPEDPAMAAILAEAMAKEFSVTGEGRAPSRPLESNSGTSEGARKGWETRRRNGWTPEQYAEHKAKVDTLVDELDKKSPDGKHPGWSHLEESLGNLDEGTINDIKAAVPEMKVDASEMTVDTTQLQHAMNEHGPGRETDPNQVPITHDDLKRLPDVLSDYDEIVAGKGKKDGKHHNAVIFKKSYGDGTICCVEIDQYSEKRKGRILRFKTMWKEKTV